MLLRNCVYLQHTRAVWELMDHILPSIPVPLTRITPKGSRRRTVPIICTSEDYLYNHIHYEFGAIHQFYTCIFKTGTDS